MRHIFASAAAVMLLLIPGAGAAQTAPPPKVVVTEPATWLRASPSFVAANSVPAAKGERYDVLARSADGQWWQLDTGAQGATWLPADLGALISGRIDAAPVISASVTVTPTKTPAGRKAKPKAAAPFPPWVPVITPEQRARYQAAVTLGKDPALFTVVGDCNSQPPVYLRRVATGEFDGSRVEPRLQAVINKFSRSFTRVSLAAKGGFSTAAMLDPTWSDLGLCGVTQGPFACEVRVSNASVVFIELGTGDQLTWKDFEKNYRPLVEHALAKGVLPVLVTKADDIETAEGAPSGAINDVIRRLAREYQVPLLDFYAATRGLPDNGLLDEGDKDFHLNDAGMYRHIEATLQTLHAIATP